jgi:hypothetical protein
MQSPSYLHFDLSQYAWRRGTNYRKEPEKYKVGKGEQGVLICKPYKSEILPFWHFKDRKAAHESSEKTYHIFLKYLTEENL